LVKQVDSDSVCIHSPESHSLDYELELQEINGLGSVEIAGLKTLYPDFTETPSSITGDIRKSYCEQR